jgi:hypothetical protein
VVGIDAAGAVALGRAMGVSALAVAVFLPSLETAWREISHRHQQRQQAADQPEPEADE